MTSSQVDEYQVAIYLGLADSFMGLADISTTQKKPEQAISYYQEAQSIYEAFGNTSSMEIKENLIYNYLGLAESYASLQNNQEAKNFYLKANQIFISMGDSASYRMKQIGSGIQRNIQKFEQDSN